LRHTVELEDKYGFLDYSASNKLKVSRNSLKHNYLPCIHGGKQRGYSLLHKRRNEERFSPAMVQISMHARTHTQTHTQTALTADILEHAYNMLKPHSMSIFKYMYSDTINRSNWYSRGR
jgi:hypothetical protein